MFRAGNAPSRDEPIYRQNIGKADIRQFFSLSAIDRLEFTIGSAIGKSIRSAVHILSLTRVFDSCYMFLVTMASHSKATQSLVWEYLKIYDQDVSKVECLVCKSSGVRCLLSRGGKKKKNFTTTNLKSHLKSVHPGKYVEMTSNETAQSIKKKENDDEEENYR